MRSVVLLACVAAMHPRSSNGMGVGSPDLLRGVLHQPLRSGALGGVGQAVAHLGNNDRQNEEDLAEFVSLAIHSVVETLTTVLFTGTRADQGRHTTLAGAPPDFGGEVVRGGYIHRLRTEIHDKLVANKDQALLDQYFCDGKIGTSVCTTSVRAVLFSAGVSAEAVRAMLDKVGAGRAIRYQLGEKIAQLLGQLLTKKLDCVRFKDQAHKEKWHAYLRPFSKLFPSAQVTAVEKLNDALGDDRREVSIS